SSFAQRLFHRRGSCWFHTDNLGFWCMLSAIDSDTCAQAATTYRNEDVIRVIKFRQYFQSYCTLTFDHFRMIKRRNESSAFLLCEGNCMSLTFIERITREYNFDIFTTKHSHLVDLLLWCNRRHVDCSVKVQRAARESHALCMVTRACTYHPAFALCGIKAVYKIVRAPDFVRANNLQVFTFQINLRAEFLRQLAMILKRCFQDYGLQYRVGAFNVDGCSFCCHILFRIKRKNQRFRIRNASGSHIVHLADGPGRSDDDQLIMLASTSCFSGRSLRTAAPACHNSL